MIRQSTVAILLAVSHVFALSQVGGAVEPVEAPVPATASIDRLLRVLDRAFDRLAAEGPTEFATDLAELDRSGQFVRQMLLLEERWKTEGLAETELRVERLKTEFPSRSVARFHYLLCLPEKPVIWSLTFVRFHQRGWLIRCFQVSDKYALLRDLFRDASAAGDFAEPQRLMNTFAHTLATDTDAALQLLMDHVSVAADDEVVKDWLRKMGALRESLDLRNPRIELLPAEALSRSLVRYTVVETAPNAYAVWEAFLYRRGEKWVIVASQFEPGNNTSLEILFPGSSANPQSSAAASSPSQRR